MILCLTSAAQIMTFASAVTAASAATTGSEAVIDLRTHHSVLLVLDKRLAANKDAAPLYSVPCSLGWVKTKPDSRHLQACERH